MASRTGLSIAFALIVAPSGCNAVFGVGELSFEDTDDGDGAAGSTGGAQTTSSSATGGTGGAGATGGSGGIGGLGGGGGEPSPLVSHDLVVRYYVDEASSGTEPAELADAGPAPAFPLAIDYDGTLSWSEEPTGRALTFPTWHGGVAAAPTVTGTKIRDLMDGSQVATVEVVFEATFNPSELSQYIFMYKEDGNPDGRLGLGLLAGRPYAEFNSKTPNGNDATQVWDAFVFGSGRSVAHLVVDTTAPDPTDRVTLYLDGRLVPIDTTPNIPIVLPPQGEGLDTCEDCKLVLGNNIERDRPFLGKVHYAAIYRVVLTVDEITQNAAELATFDDGPAPR